MRLCFLMRQLIVPQRPGHVLPAHPGRPPASDEVGYSLKAKLTETGGNM